MPLTSKTTGDAIPASDHNEIYNLLKTTTDKEWITFTHKGADIVSAGTLTLGSDGNYFDVTGTTGITGISSRQAGTMVILQFDGAVTLTNSATLVLQGAANVTTAAGDVLVFIADSTTVWRQIGWLTASGFVTLTGTETLTNKTLTSPTIANFTNAAHDHGDADDGGALVAAAVNGLTLTTMTLTAPTIADFTNAAHDHGDADDGGTLVAAAVNNLTLTGMTLTSPVINTQLTGTAVGTGASQVAAGDHTHGAVAEHGIASHTDRTLEMFFNPMMITTDDGGTATRDTATAATSSQRLAWTLDDTSAENLIFSFIVPGNWASGALTFKWWYFMYTATSGNVVIRTRAFSTADGASIDIAAELDASDTVAVPGTAELVDVHTVSATLTVAASDMVQVFLGRVAADASDTAAGNLGLLGIEVEYTADQ